MLRSCLAALLLAALLVPAHAQPIACGDNDPPPNPATIPDISVKIERVDTARYPEVDLYFRVIDTNATTSFVPLRRDYLTLEEGTGGSLTPINAGNIVSDNFTGRDPDMRALATAVVLDRSSSVDSVLPFIRQAILEFVDLMQPAPANTYRLDPNSPQRPDTTMAIGLAGSRPFPPDSKYKPYTSDKQDLRAWVDQNFRDTQGGSPIFPAADVAAEETKKKTDYDLPDGSRLVFLISDGQNNRPYPNPTPAGFARAPNQAINTARAGRVRVYTMGMVFINNNGVAPGNICRRSMRAIAEQTGATYFEPINPFPIVPPAPDPGGASLTDPADLNDNVARTFLNERLATLANLAERQNLDDRELPLPADVKQILQIVMNPLPDPYTYKEFVRGVPTTSPTGTAIPGWTAATLPTLTQLDQVNYQMLQGVQTQTELLARGDVTQEELSRASYYHDQVRNVLTKIQASEKRIYRLTFKTDNAPYDGSLRDIRLTVRYRSDVNGVAKDLNPGTDAINYKAPSRVEEDPASPIATDYDVASSPANDIVFGPRDPRNQPWTREPRVNFVTRLMTEVPATADRPAEKFAVAEIRNGDFRELGLPANLADRPEVLAHVNAEKADYRALMDITPSAAFDSGSGRLIVSIDPKVPTAITNPTDAVLRPVPNASQNPRKHLQWYEITGTADRDYNYQASEPTGLVNRVGTARVALPTFTYYVVDKTPPTLGIYLTPVGGNTGMVAVRSRAPDENPAPQVLIQGVSVGVPGSADTLTNGFTLGPPFRLDGGGSTPGFMVPQNVQVRIQVVAKDNYDRNRDHSYVLERPRPTPPSDRYSLDTINDEAAKDFLAPYMPRVSWDSLEDGVPVNAEGNHTSGVSWRLVESDQPTDTLTDNKIFRAANVSVVDDTFQVTPGQEIFLEVKASDAAGKKSFVRVPIVVTPMGVNIGKLTYESRRAR